MVRIVKGGAAEGNCSSGKEQETLREKTIHLEYADLLIKEVVRNAISNLSFH